MIELSDAMTTRMLGISSQVAQNCATDLDIGNTVTPRGPEMSTANMSPNSTRILSETRLDWESRI